MENINETLQQLLLSEYQSLSLFDVCLSLVIPFLLSFIITWTYKKTVAPSTYSIDMSRSMFLFSVVTSFLTLIIGGNVARAFGLVGALSLIRFRTVLKSPIQTVYLFWSLGVGMSCGASLFLPAVLMTLFGSFMMFFLMKINQGEDSNIYSMIKICTDINKPKDFEDNILHISQKHNLNIQKVDSYFNIQEDSLMYIYQGRTREISSIQNFYKEIEDNKNIKNIHIYNNEMSLFI